MVDVLDRPAPPAPVPPAEVTIAPRRQPLLERLRPYLLLSPVVLLYAFAFLVPFVILVWTSLRASPVPGVVGDFVGLEQYRTYFNRPGVWSVIWRTLRISLIVPFICLAIAYPTASNMLRMSPRARSAAFIAVLSPMVISVLSRIFGWWTILGPGPIGDTLGRWFLGRETGGVLYSETAIVIGTASIFLPFMLISILAALQGVGSDLRRAAESLGATRSQITRTIDIPLALPGILGGLLLVFALTMGSYVSATLLGGSKSTVIAEQTVQFSIVQFNRPLSAVVAVILILSAGAVSYLNSMASARSTGTGG